MARSLTPGCVATVSTGALTVTVILATIATELIGSPREGAFLDVVVGTALGSALVGALVWVGTYIGARNSPPNQRSDRLVRTLSLIFIGLGLLVSLPIRTHAVRLEMPGAGHTPADVDWSALLMSIGLLVLCVV